MVQYQLHGIAKMQLNKGVLMLKQTKLALAMEIALLVGYVLILGGQVWLICDEVCKF